MNHIRRNLLKGVAVLPTIILMNGACEKVDKNRRFKWEGYVLGTDSSIQAYGNDEAEFDRVIEDAVLLIKRLEHIFSLYDPTSEIVKLNETGKLENASQEMIELITISKSIYEKTNGAFDITVQPLWQLYDDYMINKNQNEFDSKLEEVKALIGSEMIHVSGNKISFENTGMAISSNGIAQGYITDKVTSFLKDNGFIHSLINIGEYCAGGPQLNNEPWRIGLLDPFDQISVADVVELSKGGLATSGGYGTVFDDTGEANHLFNPETGLSPNLYASVTVIADDATTADALSTAFSNMEISSIKSLLKDYNAKARLTMRDGSVIQL